MSKKCDVYPRCDAEEQSLLNTDPGLRIKKRGGRPINFAKERPVNPPPAPPLDAKKKDGENGRN